MKQKQGITMIMLVITVLVVLLLVATIAAQTGNAVDNSRLSVFANDLKEIEDATKVYNIQNNTIPVLGEDRSYSKGEILDLVPVKYKTAFNQELTANNDNVVNSNEGKFYKIDLAKIGVEQTTRGTQKDDSGKLKESDVYVLSYPSMNIYYLEGVRAKGSIYFSFSSRLSKQTSIARDSEQENGETRIFTSSGITVKRPDMKDNNILNVTIEVEISNGESVYLRLASGARHILETTNGRNTIYIGKNFNDVKSYTLNKFLNIGVTQAELDEFNSYVNKTITITKENSGNVIGEVTVPLTKYDNKKPVKTTNAVVSSKEENNNLTFKVLDQGTGIGEVRYEYISTYNKDGQIQNYYNGVSTFDSEYMSSKAKKANISTDGNAEITLPKDIQKIQINVIDKSGNVSDNYFETINLPVYVGIYEKEFTLSKLVLDMVFKTSAKIDSVNVSTSIDGIGFSNAQDITLQDTGAGIYKSTLSYGTIEGAKENVYVKVIVNYNNGAKETHIKQIKR